MIIALLVILVLVLTLPFILKIAEHNLEIFLFIMGLCAVIATRVLSWHLVGEIFANPFLYFITGAVLIFGLLFIRFKDTVTRLMDRLLFFIPLRVFVFLLIVVLGILSSILTAIIAALLLCAILSALPIDRRMKINLDIIACFSIGLGAVLTPVGEPLATVVISKLDQDFFYLFREVGVYVIPGVIAMGLVGFVYTGRAEAIKKKKEEAAEAEALAGIEPSPSEIKELEEEEEQEFEDERVEKEIQLEEFEAPETVRDAVIRAVKIFLFVFALELLGTGFKPLIDAYVIPLSNKLLFWINMVSAILDNATLASAEISSQMNNDQIQAILMGLLISGGMLIPGNIPNIISAGKLKIKSREWGRLGVPLGLITMAVYFVVMFLI